MNHRLRMFRSTGQPWLSNAPGHRDQFALRPLAISDVEGLAAVLFRAYEGGPEQEEDTIAAAAVEVSRCVDGEYGEFMWSQCSVAVGGDDVVVGAALINLFGGRPLLSHVIVEPLARGLGIGTKLITASTNALHTAGHAAVDLAVGVNNVHASRLYLRLGFRLWDGGSNRGWHSNELLASTRTVLAQAMPDFVQPVAYAVLHLHDGVVIQSIANVDGQHQLPAYMLAIVTGYRNGTSVMTLARQDLDAAIALLEPAETNSNYEHPNLLGWRSIASTVTDDDRLVAVFSSTVSSKVELIEYALRHR
jgi:GNAT superfamily N-acetyltransferase